MKYIGYLAVAVLVALSVRSPPATAQDREQRLIQRWRAGEWRNTDFAKRSIELEEIFSGGPPRDGIPPIDDPKFVPVAAAADWLEAGEPVLVYRERGDVRAYPLQILIWHEIVNDTVGGRPVVITFCPLCNSAIVFDRRVGGQTLTFGTSGKLRYSDLVMWDRQTESWWQQLTGEGIVGTHTGQRLKFLPAPLVSFGTFRKAYPEARVLSRDTGVSRPYGNNPYEGYDRPGNSPFLFRGVRNDRLPPMERVVAIEAGDQARAYPYTSLSKKGVVHDTFAGMEIVIFHRPGAKSALDARSIAASRDVGEVGVFESELEGRPMRFRAVKGGFEDRESGSRWTVLGLAVKGPLAGKRLRPVVHANHFAFAWLAFRPHSTVWKAP